MEAFFTDALAIHTLPIAKTVIRTLWNAAVLTSKMRETHTFSISALPLIIAVAWTCQLAAVFSCVTLITHTFPIYTSPIVVALIRTGGHRAIGSFPS